MPQWFLVSGLTVLLAFLFGKAFVSAQKQYAKEQQLLEEEAAAGMSGIAAGGPSGAASCSGKL